MQRRNFLRLIGMLPLLSGCIAALVGAANAAIAAATKSKQRVRPSDPSWPSGPDWDALNHEVGGRLIRPQSPFANCDPGTARGEALKHLKNPYFLGDEVALTQTSGWVDAWSSEPSPYAVAAETTADVVAAVNFARTHDLRLVVKGGGHSYQGGSCAPDSLLVWMRRMNGVSLDDAFVAHDCAGKTAPQPAVTLGAGAMWIDAYDAVTTRGNRYVQGGGCVTVGVAGLIQSGGFGSFSKNYGTAAAGLLEAEIVTADGEVRIANACTHPDLFWGIKGGGGGTLGIVTRLTLRTRELPQEYGAVFGTIRATTDAAYRALIAKAIDFYRSALFNSQWGEQMIFRADNTLRINMLFQGIGQRQAEQTWAPWIDWVRAHADYSFTGELQVLSAPAQHIWDAEFFRQHAPQLIVEDDRPNAPAHHVLWAGDQEQAGQYLHGYASAWLPAALLQPDRQSRLADAIFASTRHWDMSLHFNKGLAGAPAQELAAAKDTAMNPAVLDAFALAIIGAEGPPAFPGIPGVVPDLADARAAAAGVSRAMQELLHAAPGAGSYLAESDYFERSWQSSFWGKNYSKLAAVKRKYDPTGLFFVRHCVGSEDWSADGFTRVG